jgi:hypothetical protein
MLGRAVGKAVVGLTVLALWAAACSRASADGIGVGYVQPSTGDISTRFTWRVKLYSLTTNPQLLHETAMAMILNDATGQGSWHTMWPLDPSDLNYQDGKWYTFSSYLPAGTYRFLFKVSYLGNTFTWPLLAEPLKLSTWPIGPVVGPLSQRDMALEAGGVTPSSGTELTDFTWRVEYFGANDAPPDAVWVGIYSQSTGTTWRRMQPEDPSNTAYRYGAWFYFTMRGLDGSLHAFRFVAQRGGQSVYYPKQAGAYVPGPAITTVDERLIQTLYTLLGEAMNAHNQNAVLLLCSSGLLHDGGNLDTFAWRLDRMLTRATSDRFNPAQAKCTLTWTLTNLKVFVSGSAATASYHLNIGSDLGGIFDRDVTAANDPFGLASLRKEGGFWRFCGNQAHFGAEAVSGSEPPARSVELFVRDDLHEATSVTASGPGIAGSASLSRGTRFDRSGWWLDVDAAAAPSPPFTYNVTVSRAGGTTLLMPVVTAFVPEPAPQSLQPSDGHVITGTPTFSWSAGTNLAHSYTVQCFAPGGAELWQVQDLWPAQNSVKYDGWPLGDEILYTWRVRGYDDDGNFVQTTETFRHVTP